MNSLNVQRDTWVNKSGNFFLFCLLSYFSSSKNKYPCFQQTFSVDQNWCGTTPKIKTVTAQTTPPTLHTEEKIAISSIKGTGIERLSDFTFFHRRWFQITACSLQSASLKYSKLELSEGQLYGWERSVHLWHKVICTHSLKSLESVVFSQLQKLCCWGLV